MAEYQINQTRRALEKFTTSLGNLLMDGFHYAAVFIIVFLIIWSAKGSLEHMIIAGRATIDDVLLMFIYLELMAMAGIYFKTSHMPVRFLIYVAMTALTRLLIADIQHVHKPTPGILIIGGATVLFAIAAFILSYSSYKYPAVDQEETRID